MTRLGVTLALLLVATSAAGGSPTKGRIAGPAGSMCSEGEKYEAIRVEGKWKALCYVGDLDEARELADADPSCPSSEYRAPGCRTCSLEEDFYVKALTELEWLELRRLIHE